VVKVRVPSCWNEKAPDRLFPRKLNLPMAKITDTSSKSLGRRFKSCLIFGSVAQLVEQKKKTVIAFSSAKPKTALVVKITATSLLMKPAVVAYSPRL